MSRTGLEHVEEHNIQAQSRVKSPSAALKRNKMTLHLFGTSRLHEELKFDHHGNNKPSKLERPIEKTSVFHQGLIRFPVQYKFWAPANASLQKSFNNRMDRRIISICRQSRCIVQLQSAIRKNANGMGVQQISIQAPSLGALERCCSILDAVFPQFNASKSLRGRTSDMTLVSDNLEEVYPVYQGDVDILQGGCHRRSHYRINRFSSYSHQHVEKVESENDSGLMGFLLSHMECNGTKNL